MESLFREVGKSAEISPSPNWYNVAEQYHNDLYAQHSMTTLLGCPVPIPVNTLTIYLKKLDVKSVQRRRSAGDFNDEAAKKFGEFYWDPSDENRKLAGEIISDGNSQLVIGSAGMGKTTLLKQIALHVIKGEKACEQKLPIFVDLTDHVKRKVTLLDLIATQFGQLQILRPKAFTPALLSTSRAIVLIDGLGEISSHTGEREKWWKEVVELITQYPQCQVIVTCRTESADFEIEHPSLNYCEVASLNESQMQQLVEHRFGEKVTDEIYDALRYHENELFTPYRDRYFELFSSPPVDRANENPFDFRARMLSSFDREKWLLTQGEVLSAFWYALRDKRNVELRHRAENPYHLNAMCAHYIVHQSLPNHCIERHRQLIYNLVQQWDDKIEPRYSPFKRLSHERKLLLYAHLAQTLFNLGQSTLDKETTQKSIEQYYHQKVPTQKSNVKGAKVLETLLAQQSVIVESTDGRIRFTHALVHEFLVAQSFAVSERYDELVAFSADSRWKQLFDFAVQLSNEQGRKLLIAMTAYASSLIEDNVAIQKELDWVNEFAVTYAQKTGYRAVAMRVLILSMIFSKNLLEWSNQFDPALSISISISAWIKAFAILGKQVEFDGYDEVLREKIREFVRPIAHLQTMQPVNEEMDRLGEFEGEPLKKHILKIATLLETSPFELLLEDSVQVFKNRYGKLPTVQQQGYSNIPQAYIASVTRVVSCLNLLRDIERLEVERMILSPSYNG